MCMILSHIKWQFFQDLKFQNRISDWVPFCITFKAMIFCKTICLALLDMYISTHIHILEPVVLDYSDRPREYGKIFKILYVCTCSVGMLYCFGACTEVREQLIGVRVSSLLPSCVFWGRNSGNQAYWHYVPSTQKTFKTMQFNLF